MMLKLGVQESGVSFLISRNREFRDAEHWTGEHHEKALNSEACDLLFVQFTWAVGLYNISGPQTSRDVVDFGFGLGSV
jgi:hypothetical protein